MLYYAQACNEFAGPISSFLRMSNTAPFEEMLQLSLAVSNTVSDLTYPIFESQTYRSLDERVTARLKKSISQFDHKIIKVHGLTLITITIQLPYFIVVEMDVTGFRVESVSKCPAITIKCVSISMRAGHESNVDVCFEIITSHLSESHVRVIGPPLKIMQILSKYATAEGAGFAITNYKMI